MNVAGDDNGEHACRRQNCRRTERPRAHGCGTKATPATPPSGLDGRWRRGQDARHRHPRDVQVVHGVQRGPELVEGAAAPLTPGEVALEPLAIAAAEGAVIRLGEEPVEMSLTHHPPSSSAGKRTVDPRRTVATWARARLRRDFTV